MSADAQRQQLSEDAESNEELFGRLADRYSGTDMARVFEILGQSLSENEDANS